MISNDIKYSSFHYLIALLKEYGIKNIVASPGTQNAAFNLFVQDDDFFNVYSVVDERSAVYVANGIAIETNEPVVITCTEATASRNWLSGLTEAYYSKLPIIACSFFNSDLNKFSFSQQFVDRSVSQNDIKEMSVELPKITNEKEKNKALTVLNAALSTAKNFKTPVHINCPAFLDVEQINNIKSLPKDIYSTEVYKANFPDFSHELDNQKVAIFIGAHSRFSLSCENAISEFAKKLNIPVFCDSNSNYYGHNKILISQLNNKFKNDLTPDIIIDIGEVCGEYSSFALFSNAKIWRISPDNKFHTRYNKPIEKLFCCEEEVFFNSFKNLKKTAYFDEVSKNIVKFNSIDLPFSLPYIARGLSYNLPINSTLHLAILNSLRSMNYFDLAQNINVKANVGGFGIDGACSTLVGQSLVDENKKCFGLVGDLAFFYDMNILGNRHLKNNLRFLLVNNNKGAEFHLKTNSISKIENKIERLNKIVSAAGHFSNGAKAWAEACGFEYFCANDKNEFDNLIKDFCLKEFEKPVLFECFTNVEDENEAIKVLENEK
ncbi:MAG: hypothetical protein IJD57_01040 [Candidatus Gastranaerophilales bacterium]|nr:hypothetical protein [Candidatus Gastranaerophilales bacterium]